VCVNDASHFTQFSLEHPRNQHFLSQTFLRFLSLSLSIYLSSSSIFFYHPPFRCLSYVVGPLCPLSTGCPPRAIARRPPYQHLCAQNRGQCCQGCGTIHQNNFRPYLSHCHSKKEWCWDLWRTVNLWNTIIRVKSEYPKTKAAFTQQRTALLDCPKQWV